MHGTVYTDVLEHRTDCSRGRDAVTQVKTTCSAFLRRKKDLLNHQLTNNRTGDMQTIESQSCSVEVVVLSPQVVCADPMCCR